MSAQELNEYVWNLLCSAALTFSLLLIVVDFIFVVRFCIRKLRRHRRKHA